MYGLEMSLAGARRPGLRRTTILLAAVAACMSLTVWMAPAAQAHRPILGVKVECDKSLQAWVVTWSVGNSETTSGRTMTLDTVSFDGPALSHIVPGASVGANGAPIVESHQGDRGKTYTLVVTADWDKGGPQDVKVKEHVTIPDKDCKSHEPPPPHHDSANVAISPEACDPESGLGAASVSVDPSGSATVSIYDSEGALVATVTESGEVGLAPGSYTWAAEPGEGFEVEGDSSGSFDVAPCETTTQQVTVSVSGACVNEGDAGVGSVEVTVSLPGAVTVQILDGDQVVATTTESVSVPVDEGSSLTWTATPGEGYVVDGPDGGTIDVDECTKSIVVEVSGVCRFDTPILEWKVTPINFSASEVTITWLDIAGQPGEVHPLSGEMVWPGAVVENGKVIDWPGWIYVDSSNSPIPPGTPGGHWVQGADGFENTRPTTDIQFQVNPAMTVTVTYPGGDPTCQGPPDDVLGEEFPPPDDQSSSEGEDTLPFTGAADIWLGIVAVAMLGAGAAMVRLSRSGEQG